MATNTSRIQAHITHLEGVKILVPVHQRRNLGQGTEFSQDISSLNQDGMQFKQDDLCLMLCLGHAGIFRATTTFHWVS